MIEAFGGAEAEDAEEVTWSVTTSSHTLETLYIAWLRMMTMNAVMMMPTPLRWLLFKE